jgi:hypothetical protein
VKKWSERVYACVQFSSRSLRGRRRSSDVSRWQAPEEEEGDTEKGCLRQCGRRLGSVSVPHVEALVVADSDGDERLGRWPVMVDSVLAELGADAGAMRRSDGEEKMEEASPDVPMREIRSVMARRAVVTSGGWWRWHRRCERGHQGMNGSMAGARGTDTEVLSQKPKWASDMWASPI